MVPTVRLAQGIRSQDICGSWRHSVGQGGQCRVLGCSLSPVRVDGARQVPKHVLHAAMPDPWESGASIGSGTHHNGGVRPRIAPR